MGKPKIRFKGYNDEWEQRKLGEVAQEFKSGNFLKADEIDIAGDYPVYGGNGLRGYTSTYNHDGEFALIGRQGALCGNMNYSVGKAYFTEHAVVVEADENNDTRFLYCMLDIMNLGQYSDQSAQPGLAVNKLIKLENFFPQKEEQQQIGWYFNTLDRLITLHQRIIYKFSEKLTFTWEQRKLGDLADRVTRKNQDLVSELPLTISAQYGLIDQNEFFDKRVASKDVSGYYLIENGEFAYNKSTDAPWGAIKRLDRYENGVLSTLYIVFGIKENNPVDSDFLVLYYSTNLWHKGIHEIAAEGARNHGLLNIAPADFFETKLMISQDIEEQNKIGKYFEELERLITLHQRNPCNLNKFMAFDWEQRKLGDIAEFSKGSGYSKGDLIESGTPIILYGRLYTKYETSISEVDTYVKAKDGSVYSKGGEVIVPASGETAEDIARAATVDKSGIILGGDLNVVSPNEDINSAFLAISISHGNSQRELAKKAQGKSVVHIHNEEIKNLVVPFPAKAEQNKIEEYFSNLDNIITLHQRKYDEMKTLKKYMLQKMFPQNGPKIPKIRFEGFTGEWEQRKFGEIVEKYEDPIETPTEGYTRLGIRSHAKGTFHSYVEKGKELETAKMFRVAADKFIVNITFGWEHAVAITDENDAGKLVSHRFPQYSFNTGMNPKFFRYLILDENFKHHLELSSPGGAGRNRVLKLSDMLQYKMNFPSEAEQKKIAAYFDDLDNLITLHQRKCNELKNIKKFMLQSMFV